MSFPTAGSGFMVLLLSVSVVQGQGGWGVKYYPRQICALKGSTVEIRGTYEYPSRINGEENKLLRKFWFTRKEGEEFIDVETDVKYSGRVKNTCDGNQCTLRISDLREGDSAEYKFRMETNLNKYFGQPGVTLNIRGSEIQVEVRRPHGRLLFKCLSRCPGFTSFVWFKNGQKIQHEYSQYYPPGQVLPTDRYSCAAPGYEESPSPPVYAPGLPSVSVSPSGEIVKGSSVNLTCSSDANPAASYTWFKEDGDSPKASGEIFTITNFRAEHSGNYSCEAQNKLGRQKSTLHLVVVSGGGTSAPLVAGSVAVVLLVLVLLVAFLWIRKKRSSSESPEAEERADSRQQGQPEEQEDLQYSSIHFSKEPADLYSNIRPAGPTRHTEQQDHSEYAAVRCAGTRSSTRTGGQGSGVDPAALYSTVNKSR